MTETALPKRHFVRSDVALYVLMLFAVIGVIVAGNAASTQWGWPRFYVQITLYAILLVAGWLIYRFCLTSFQYTLTDRMLTVDRAVGKKVKGDAHVHLTDIVSVRPFEQREGDGGKKRNLYVGKRADTVAVRVRTGADAYTMLLSPSKDFSEKLLQQWKIAKK